MLRDGSLEVDWPRVAPGWSLHGQPFFSSGRPKYYASQKLAGHDWLIFFANENQKNAGARRNLWVEVRYVQ